MGAKVLIVESPYYEAICSELAKGALQYEKAGREYRYSPAVQEADCVRAESRSFLRRVYGGALKPMLATFLEEEDLSQKEIDDLRQLLERMGRE